MTLDSNCSGADGGESLHPSCLLSRNAEGFGMPAGLGAPSTQRPRGGLVRCIVGNLRRYRQDTDSLVREAY